MQLKALVEQIPGARVDGPLDREISSIAYDSRRVTAGTLFVAVPGQHVDGHEFIGMAIERGAAAILCERNGFMSPRVTKVIVPDVREAMALAAAAFYEHPSEKLKVIGVTGTNGKTTVAFLVRHLLEAGGIRCGLLGTVRYEIGERVLPAQRTTPESVEVQQMLAQMVRAQCRACVMEVSSHALEQKRVSGVAFDVTVFTNLTQDHLDYHGTMENYYLSKRKLFVAASGSKKRAAVINIDDVFGVRLAEQTQAEVQLTYGLSQQAKLRATGIELSVDATRFVLETPERHFACRLPLIGRHNIYNALAAVGTALVLKLNPAGIPAALQKALPVPGRLEPVTCGQPFGVYVDYAHTEDALRNVLGTLRELTEGRLLLVFGCGGNRDAGKRAKMGEVAARQADFTIVTNDNPRRESPESIASQVSAGYRSVRAENLIVELNRRQAIRKILKEATAGDTVLIAGKGHETYQELDDTVIPFDDRHYAREALETLGFSACLQP